MANYNQQARKPLPKTAFDELKLRMEGPPQEGQRRPPNLRVSVIKNSPRIDVFTNIENDRDNGRISAPMDAMTFFTLVELTNNIADGEPDNQIMVANKTGRPGEQRVISHTVIGKDREGRCFISVIAQDRPKIKFTFAPSAWHSMVKMDGTPVPEAEVSVVYAKAWARLMAELVPNVLDHHFEERVFSPKGGNGGGGNYNSGGNASNQKPASSKTPGNDFGGTQPSSGSDFDDFGDDFPM